MPCQRGVMRSAHRSDSRAVKAAHFDNARHAYGWCMCERWWWLRTPMCSLVRVPTTEVERLPSPMQRVLRIFTQGAVFCVKPLTGLPSLWGLGARVIN